MAMLNETKPKFAIRQVAQGASYFNILEGQGFDNGVWNMKRANAKSL